MGRLHVMQSGVEATGRWSFLTRECQCSSDGGFILSRGEAASLFFFFLSFFLFNYWLRWVFFAAFRLSLWQTEATLHCGAQASHCSGFSCCRAQAVGARASEVVAHRLRCLVAYGIFLDQGLNPCPLHWQAES